MRRLIISMLCLVATAGAVHAQSPLSQLHDALHLSAAQEQAWRAYQQAVGPDAQEAARARETARMMPTLPTPRRIALARAQMQADMAAFDRRAAATQTFYATLDPDQQRTFDRQTAAALQVDPAAGPNPRPAR